jgi:hypothetical protein
MMSIVSGAEMTDFPRVRVAAGLGVTLRTAAGSGAFGRSLLTETLPLELIATSASG